MAVSKLTATQSEAYTPTPRRPQLIWQGRERRRVADPVPAQTLEIVRPVHLAKVSHGTAAPGLWQGEEGAPQNRLIWTNDNLVALTSLLCGDDQHAPLEGKVDLIYIDPPFAVQNNFSINVEIEDGVSDEKLPTLIEQLAYEDTWKDGLDSYLSMMRDRLEQLKRLLAPTGSIYVHCDWHAGHYLKVLLDEVFGYENFRNEVVWKRTSAHSDVKQGAKQFGRSHDILLWYSSSESYTFHSPFADYSSDYQDKHYGQVDSDGRRFKTTDLTAARPGGDTSYPWKGVTPPTGRYWAYSRANMEEFERQGRLYYTSTNFPRLKQYLDEMPGVPVPDLWDDIFPVNSQALERISFPTQKPLALLQRVIAVSSNPGDLVLDAFIGSGTTAVAAETMQDENGKPAPRRWVAIDCGKFAIHIARKRMIEAQAHPFAVESIGFYSRADTWQSVLAKRPSARIYRDALVEIYGGQPIEGFT